MREGLVFCVHGFLRTGASMAPAALALRRRGWDVEVVSQLNLHRTVPQLGDLLYARVMRSLDRRERSQGRVPPVHFVTHSLGGIVARSALSRHELPGPTRAVLLAPPNAGSRLARHMRDRVLRQPWGAFDPLGKLLPGGDGQCADAGRPEACFGVIAGALPEGQGARWNGFPGVGFRPDTGHGDDGKVAVDEARWDHACDFLVVPSGHAFIMNRPAVLRQVDFFLREGRFERG